MGTFELAKQRDSANTPPTGWAGLETLDLLRNARWFTRIRWGVILTMASSSVIHIYLPGLFIVIGVCLPTFALFNMAIALTATNLLYILLLRHYNHTTPRRRLFRNLWMQILFDLIVLTVLVHLAGSITTFVSLAYLFHIVLACIFFAPPYSLLVTLLSGLLFISVVVLELTGVLLPRSMLIHAVIPPGNEVGYLLHALSAIVLWVTVWYLVAFISQALRKRDRQLAEANDRLIHAEADQNRQVLRTTHDLKAPFSGIESNTLLLRTLYWDQLAEPVREIIQRIEIRSAALRERIRDIITLGAIKAQDQAPITTIERVDVPAVVAGTIKELQDKASQRGITISTVGSEGTAYTSPEHVKALLANLIANAIFYSHEGGTVSITTTIGKDRAVIVSITDQGIGIREDALPHIFDEYFRTREASEFNAMSTGLGLAIVKRIAGNLGLTIIVDSEIGRGTTFRVVIPHRTTPSDPAATKR